MAQLRSVQVALSLSKDPSKVLGLRTTTGAEVAPGQFVSKQDLAQMPQMSWKGPDDTYVLVKVDLDAPYPSWPFLSPNIHYIQSGLAVDAQGGNKLSSKKDVRPIAPYRPPAPPPASSPHRYVFLLFKEPGAFDPESEAGPSSQGLGLKDCVRFNFEDFLKRTGLPVEPVAATWITSK